MITLNTIGVGVLSYNLPKIVESIFLCRSSDSLAFKLNVNVDDVVFAKSCKILIVNISRYEGHRYAFEIHQYT